MSVQLLERGTLGPADGPSLPMPSASRVRPFGLSRAVPVRPAAEVLPALTLCPDRQISVTQDGKPFIFEPHMASSFTTTAQTQEDHQLDESTENDTD